MCFRAQKGHTENQGASPGPTSFSLHSFPLQHGDRSPSRAGETPDCNFCFRSSSSVTEGQVWWNSDPCANFSLPSAHQHLVSFSSPALASDLTVTELWAGTLWGELAASTAVACQRLGRPPQLQSSRCVPPGPCQAEAAAPAPCSSLPPPQAREAPCAPQ